MSDNKLNKLKEDYTNVPIPEELDFLVKKTLKERGVEMRDNKNTKKVLIALASIAASFAIVVVGVNTNYSVAESLGNIPIIGGVIKVLTFREYKIDEDHYSGDIVTPQIEGLENKDLQNSLNAKYIAENKKLYEEFIAEIEEMKKNSQGYLAVDSGYKIQTDTDEILSILRYTVVAAGSASEILKYDTISKKDNILITLPSLFKDDSYIEIISKNIKEQMIKKNREDDSYIYWVEGVDDSVDGFEKIAPDQSFYINENNKLVISFNEYEVAPGMMGSPEFLIPTEILSDVLVGNSYIK